MNKINNQKCKRCNRELAKGNTTYFCSYCQDQIEIVKDILNTIELIKKYE